MNVEVYVVQDKFVTGFYRKMLYACAAYPWKASDKLVFERTPE